MRPNKVKTQSKDIGQENAELMKELERIQKEIERSEAACQQIEKENQKLKMLQNFNSVFNKTQTSKDSALITQVLNGLKAVKETIEAEVNEIGKLKKEQHLLKNKNELVDQELERLRPSGQDPAKRLIRESSFREFR